MPGRACPNEAGAWSAWLLDLRHEFAVRGHRAPTGRTGPLRQILAHGYFLPAKGASDRAEALLIFESLAAHERCRSRFGEDPVIAADRIRDEPGCVLRYDRSFMRPLLPDGTTH